MRTLFILLCLAGLLHAQPPDSLPELRTLDGKLFKRVKITKVDAAEIRIAHEEGFAVVPLSKLPPEVLALFGGKTSLMAEQAAKAVRETNNSYSVVPTAPAPAPAATAPSAAAAEPMPAAASAITLEENVRRASQWYQWCLAHPQGDAQVSQAQRNALLAQSMAVLRDWQGQQAPVSPQAARSGPLSTRPATPSGRSASDPQRMAEQIARRQRQQMPQGGQQAALSEFIAAAIVQRQRLVISYADGADGPRLIEPHLLGVTTLGNPAVLAWFVSGASASGQGPDWRIYLLERITGIEATDEMFTPRRDFDGTGGGKFQSYKTRIE